MQAVGVSAVHIADIDGDGALDLVLSNSLTGDVQWYRQNKPDSFSSPTTVLTGLPGVVLVKVADISADGIVDILSIANSRFRLLVSS